jgi:hypothetical protein
LVADGRFQAWWPLECSMLGGQWGSILLNGQWEVFTPGIVDYLTAIFLIRAKCSRCVFLANFFNSMWLIKRVFVRKKSAKVTRSRVNFFWNQQVIKYSRILDLLNFPPVAKLANYSCGWSPVWLHHKIKKQNPRVSWLGNWS